MTLGLFVDSLPIIHVRFSKQWLASRIGFTSAPGEPLRLHRSLSAWTFSSFHFTCIYLVIYLFHLRVIVGSYACVSAVSGSIPSSHAGETVVFSYLHQRAKHKKPVHSRRDRGPERHLPSLPLSFSFSPPLCHLWQHLLPLLLFPIVRWACPLSCPPSSLF